MLTETWAQWAQHKQRMSTLKSQYCTTNFALSPPDEGHTRRTMMVPSGHSFGQSIFPQKIKLGLPRNTYPITSGQRPVPPFGLGEKEGAFQFRKSTYGANKSRTSDERANETVGTRACISTKSRANEDGPVRKSLRPEREGASKSAFFQVSLQNHTRTHNWCGLFKPKGKKSH